MGVKLGIAAVVLVGATLVILGVLFLVLGQGVELVPLWVATMFGGFVLLVVGLHILLASILTYLRARRELRKGSP